MTAAFFEIAGCFACQVPLGRLAGTVNAPGLQNTGSPALGGPIATAGGVVFTAGALEPAIYAFDVRTGQQLWKGALPTSARATPMTYLGRDRRQYNVVAAGGHGLPIGPPLGDYLVARALPRSGSAAPRQMRIVRATSDVTCGDCGSEPPTPGLEKESSRTRAGTQP